MDTASAARTGGCPNTPVVLIRHFEKEYANGKPPANSGKPLFDPSLIDVGSPTVKMQLSVALSEIFSYLESGKRYYFTLFVSPLARTVQTAELINERLLAEEWCTGTETIIEPLIGEFFGNQWKYSNYNTKFMVPRVIEKNLFTRETIDRYTTTTKSNGTTSAGGVGGKPGWKFGETLADLDFRVTKFGRGPLAKKMEEVKREKRKKGSSSVGRVIVVVSHGIVLGRLSDYFQYYECNSE